jgi:uncharacterized protein
MRELARFERGWDHVVVSLDGDELVFHSAFEDFGRTQTTESRMRADDFVARGEGPWPWYDLGDRREGALLVLQALGVGRPAWTTPLPPATLEVFDRAGRGDRTLADLLARGADPDPLDPCGASPLWYAVRSTSQATAVALVDAGADPCRRIETDSCGERFTTILHEIVRTGATVALRQALGRGADPTVRDSDGATPLHVVDENRDNVNPEMVRALVRAGAAVDAALPSGTQPIECAARRLLPATVASMVELGASPTRGLDALLTWWALGARYATHRADVVVDIVEMLRAGGAEVSQGHLEQAARAGTPRVESALRG